MYIKSNKSGCECITVWERSKQEFGHYEFNHISTDWKQDDYPDTVNENQRKEWANWYWRKTFAILEDGHVKINGGQNLLWESIEGLVDQNFSLRKQLDESNDIIKKARGILE